MAPCSISTGFRELVVYYIKFPFSGKKVSTTTLPIYEVHWGRARLNGIYGSTHEFRSGIWYLDLEAGGNEKSAFNHHC
jgi:hypothetical protein